ncbi:MAG: hypothetical protein LKE99_05030 [Lachnospiraceae bacterium]|nr:hypothetical protein [Lachnospiraceae bacterium]MCH4103487.1 hypothetical protein [Lachnospiraceae bacterium]
MINSLPHRVQAARIHPQTLAKCIIQLPVWPPLKHMIKEREPILSGDFVKQADDGIRQRLTAKIAIINGSSYYTDFDFILHTPTSYILQVIIVTVIH